MIIDIAHTKGGVGKSTIATNLAVEMPADLLDLDTQNSSIGFCKLGPHRPNTIFYVGQKLVKDDLQFFLDGYKGTNRRHLVIDSGGYDSEIVRLLLVCSDIIITPVAVSQVELMGLQNFDRVISEANKVSPIRAYVLFNRVTHFQNKDLETFKEYVSEKITDYKILQTQIGDRRAYKDAFASGQSVCELDERSKASGEIRSLVSEITELLK